MRLCPTRLGQENQCRDRGRGLDPCADEDMSASTALFGKHFENSTSILCVCVHNASLFFENAPKSPMSLPHEAPAGTSQGDAGGTGACGRTETLAWGPFLPPEMSHEVGQKPTGESLRGMFCLLP